jgi:hypothetical protein
MPRINLLICSGVSVLNAFAIYSQSLPKEPTPQQVISYQLQQQKIWNAQQLPKNSVLYKSDHRYARWQGLQFRFKKEMQPSLTFPLPVYQPSAVSSTSQQSLPALRANLLQQKQLFNQWRKQSWWKDPSKAQGSIWLRDFLIHSKSRSGNHLF